MTRKLLIYVKVTIIYRQLFSDNALELTMEDMAARELDFEEYKNRSMGHLRKFAIFAASVVTVGLVYTCMNLLKGALNQQHEKVSMLLVQ